MRFSVGRVYWGKIDGTHGVGSTDAPLTTPHAHRRRGGMAIDQSIVEEWRSIADTNGCVEVSNLGRVRSCRTLRSGVAPRILHGVVDMWGYRRVSINDKARAVHALVLTAFVGPRPDGHQAAHLDGDPANNALVNLAWATPSQNNLHKRQHGTMVCGERHHKAKLTTSDVLAIRRRLLAGEQGAALAREYGVSNNVICGIGRREQWRHV